MKTVWTIIIFGAQGDLTRRQLIPALYSMVKRKKHTFIVIGASKEIMAADEVITQATSFIEQPQEEYLSALCALFVYQPLNFDEPTDFLVLKKLIEQQEHMQGSDNKRILYLAAPPQYFAQITEYSAQAGIIERGNQDQRVIYEKPFGWDLASSHAINQSIEKYLTQQQIYRIDHYLTKELVSNIVLVRFTNIFFEPLWINRFIDYIEIDLRETVSLEGRGAFYDRYGALKDVVQNHMLQMAALIGMEKPHNIFDDSIKDSKAAVLSKMRAVDGILGQYEGYQEEKGVKPQSKTETYAALKLFIDTPRWKDVPFYLVTGKCLEKKSTIIRIVFKVVESCPLDEPVMCSPNVLIIRITPDEGFSLVVNAKKPYSIHESIPVSMDFCYSCLFGPDTPGAYEVLLHEVMLGERSIAVRSDEIEYQWSVIEMVKQLNLPLYTYKKDSIGPAQALEWLAHNQGKKS
ncbi:MAG: glucose-6-phosphate dehydrogenase [Candidatus Babeliaceae bacterium]